MDQCPHCRAPTVDGSKCPNCGQSLDQYPEYQSETITEPSAPPTQSGDPAPGAVETEDDGHDQTEPSNQEGESSEGPFGDRISRRALLGGAGASAAVLGLGGAGWLYVQQQSSDGDQRIKQFVDAIAANEWSQIEQLYHADSPVRSRIEQGNEFDSYAGFLESQEVLETWADLEPELDGIDEFYHVTEVTEESAEEVTVPLDEDDLGTVDEVRTAIAFLSVEVGALREERSGTEEYYKDGRINRPLNCTLVLSEREWSLWRVRGLGRVGTF